MNKVIGAVAVVAMLVAFIVIAATHGASAFGEFAKQLVTSWWAIPNLLVLGVLLLAWCRHSGRVFLALVLGLCAAIAYGGAFQQVATDLVGQSPATWFLSTLKWSAQRSDTAGWGILIIAAAIMLAVLPVSRVGVRYSRITAAEGLTTRDTAKVQAALLRRGEPYGRITIDVFVGQIVALGGLVWLWMALRRFVDVGLPLGFPPLRLPNLTVPEFRPVWGWSYVALAVILAVAMLVQAALLRSRRMTAVRPGLTNPAGIIVVVILMSLLLPAGVSLYAAGVTVVTIIILPLLLVGQPQYSRLALLQPRPEPKAAESVPLLELLGKNSPVSGDAADPFDLLGQLGMDDGAGDGVAKLGTTNNAVSTKRIGKS